MEGNSEEALREFAAAIADYRREWAESTRKGIEAELAAMEAEGLDPTRGRGRGPKWADGGLR
jgi:hypothetical protein